MGTMEKVKAKRADLSRCKGKLAALTKEKREIVKQMMHLALLEKGLTAEVEDLSAKLFDDDADDE